MRIKSFLIRAVAQISHKLCQTIFDRSVIIHAKTPVDFSQFILVTTLDVKMKLNHVPKVKLARAGRDMIQSLNLDSDRMIDEGAIFRISLGVIPFPWTLRKLKVKYLESFEMWFWRRIEKIKLSGKVINEEVLERIEEKWKLLNNILPIIANRVGHILRRNCILHDSIKGQMTEVKE